MPQITCSDRRGFLCYHLPLVVLFILILYRIRNRTQFLFILVIKLYPSVVILFSDLILWGKTVDMHWKKSRIPKSPSKTISKAWGQLILQPALTIPSITHIDLTDKTYTVGRLPDSDLSISERNVCKGILKHISRKHFAMRKQMVCGLLIVHVTDLSFNGTFINGVKIGKNNTFTLFDGDSLAIGKPSFTIFTFKDLCNRSSSSGDCRSTEDDSPPDLSDLEAELTEDSSIIHVYNDASFKGGHFNCLRLSW